MLCKEDIIQRHVDIPSRQTTALRTLTFGFNIPCDCTSFTFILIARNLSHTPNKNEENCP